MIEYLIRVEGIVQGVGYRIFAKREALQLGLQGYALNLPDGRVEILAQGEKGPLDVFTATLRRGPRMGEVQDVTVIERELSKTYGFFEVK